MTLRSLGLCIIVALAACGSSQSGSGGSSAVAATPVADSSPKPFKVTDVATFDSPWAIAFLGSTSTAVVTEKPGRMWLVDVATGQKQPISGVPAVVTEGTSDQGGLLDVAVSPTFGSDHSIYITYAGASPNGGSGLTLARAQLVRNAGGAALQGLQVLWRDPGGGDGGQFGGRIAFAPDGKTLFLSTGERQRFTPAQDFSEPLGKILHLTLEGQPAPGNPWAGKTGASTIVVTQPPVDTAAAVGEKGRQVQWPGVNLTPSEIWTLGHRNPYGLAFAPDGRLWEAEAGPRGGDELNLIERGKNYGWPVVSEGDNYNGRPIPRHSTHPEFVPPKLYWTPTITPGGMIIYTGALFPQWRGDALIPGLNGETLVHVRIRGADAAKADRWNMDHRMRGIAQGPDGAVYLLEDGDGAKLLKLTPSR